MPELLSRHRPLAFLAIAIVAQVLLLAFQIKRDSNIRLIRYWAAEIVTPGEEAAGWSFARISGVWHGYLNLHGTYAENNRLRQEVGQLELRNQELESQATEAQRLSVLLDFRNAHREAPMIAAQVIGGSADPASHTVFINRGSRDRVRANEAVITPSGIVGKIVEVAPTTAQVLLINDRDSGVGALFADSRAQGILKGTGDPQPLMAYVTNDEKVHDGEVIVTSGEDRIFPKGLLIGKVAGFKPGFPFQTIHVQTAARLDRLEDVLVLLSQHELTADARDPSSTVVFAMPVQSPSVESAQALTVPASRAPALKAGSDSPPPVEKRP